MRPEQLLRDALRSRDPDLSTHADQLIGRAAPLLQGTLRSFPSGTDHTLSHTQMVESLASLLLTNAIITQLNDHELFFLRLSCHYHDLGMAGVDADNATKEGRDQIRSAHSVAIADRLLSKWRELGFASESEATILGDVCRGHRPEKDSSGFATWNDLPSERIVGPLRYIRPRLLAAITYAADELHLGADRAPARTEDWLNIQNEESRRHWRGHQAIDGPVLLREQITFSITVQTTAFEAHLRRNVLRKASLPLIDLNRELTAAGIASPAREMAIHWNRTALWKLLTIEEAAKHEGIGQADLTEKVCSRYHSAIVPSKEATRNCLESHDTDDLLKADIESTITTLRQCGVLGLTVLADDKLCLQVSSSAVSDIFQCMRSADDLDTLFRGPYAAVHEGSLHKTPFWNRYFDSSLIPFLRNAYSVDIRLEPTDSPLKKLLAASHTACRLVLEFRPPPSILVKRQLLGLLVLAGSCEDALRDPDFILDSETRRSIHLLQAIVGQNAKPFITLLEELALVGGLSTEQLSDIYVPSDVWTKEVIDPDRTDPEMSVSISQAQSPGIPLQRTGLPYLIVAGMRSGTTIEVLHSDAQPLEFTFKSMPSNLPEGPPSMLTMSPGKPQPLPRVDLQASVHVDADSRTVTLRARPLNSNIDDSMERPILLRMPTRPKDVTGQSHFALRYRSMLVRELRAVKDFQELVRSGNCELKILNDDDQMIASSINGIKRDMEFDCVLSDELLSVLEDIDPDMPVPWFYTKRQENLLIEAARDKRKETFEQLVAEAHSKTLPPVTSITMLMFASSEKPYSEEFLGFFPGMTFKCPHVDAGGAITQEELETQFAARTSVASLRCNVKQDYLEVAQELRNWVSDQTREFPIGCESPDTDFHHSKGSVAIDYYPIRDRGLYAEHPVVIRLRASTKLEQYNTEGKYWLAVGDSERAALCAERVRQITNEDSHASN